MVLNSHSDLSLLQLRRGITLARQDLLVRELEFMHLGNELDDQCGLPGRWRNGRPKDSAAVHPPRRAKDIELGVVKDGKNEDQPVQDPTATMHFRCLRCSIRSDLRQLSSPTFEKGTESDKEATVSSAVLALRPAITQAAVQTMLCEEDLVSWVKQQQMTSPPTRSCRTCTCTRLAAGRFIPRTCGHQGTSIWCCAKRSRMRPSPGCTRCVACARSATISCFTK